MVVIISLNIMDSCKEPCPEAKWSQSLPNRHLKWNILLSGQFKAKLVKWIKTMSFVLGVTLIFQLHTEDAITVEDM